MLVVVAVRNSNTAAEAVTVHLAGKNLLCKQRNPSNLSKPAWNAARVHELCMVLELFGCLNAKS